MRAFIISPGRAGSGRVGAVPDPVPAPTQALVEVLAVGVDGTDRELLGGEYGQAPPGEDYLITGHESLGRVIDAPDGTLRRGDLVVAIVRRPDPVPCLNCAAGEWDMCLNGQYTERGIKAAHGFLAEHYAEDPRYVVRLPETLSTIGVLLEPLTVVEKAIDQIQRIQARLVWAPRRVLVLGAGSIGTLGALLLRLQGLTVYVYSRGDGGRGRAIVEAAGAEYISADERKLDHDLASEIGPLDVIIEATGYSPLAFDAMDIIGPNGVVCLTGVSAGSRTLPIDSSHLNQEMVLENKLVFGTVNANRRHFEAGAAHLQSIEARWPGMLAQMVTRRVPLEQFSANDLEHGELKVVVDVHR